MNIDNEQLTEYEPFSDDENVKIEDDIILIIKSNSTTILQKNENTKKESSLSTEKHIILNKKQIKRKNLLRIIARR
jgi:hypothetical protein